MKTLKEIVDSERDYVRSLELLSNFYITPIKANKFPDFNFAHLIVSSSTALSPDRCSTPVLVRSSPLSSLLLAQISLSTIEMFNGNVCLLKKLEEEIKAPEPMVGRRTP